MKVHPDQVLKQRYAQALCQVGEALKEQGYSAQKNSVWIGDVIDNDGKRACVSVELPAEFPDTLPVIRVLGHNAIQMRAHVERDGKICIASNNVLLDASRPVTLLQEALDRAKQVLFGNSNSHNEELLSEFMAYWEDNHGPVVYSICPPLSQARHIYAGELERVNKRCLIAESEAQASQWAKNLGTKIVWCSDAIFVPLAAPVLPPAYNRGFNLRDLCAIVSGKARAEDNGIFQEYIRTKPFPIYVLLGVPIHLETRTLALAKIQEVRGTQTTEICRGFRYGKLPQRLLLKRMQNQPVRRPEIQRLDAPYLVERGGGIVELLNTRVVVIGCGAIGSHLATALAGSGIGSLHLIDKEIVSADNIHRHAIGTYAVNLKKAEAVAMHLQSRFPHLNITYHSEDVLKLLREKPEEVTNADAIIIAIGNETIERRLNEVLRECKLRIHCWLEPLGLGGHVIAVSGKTGCYECLIRTDDTVGLLNMASLVELGQDFEKSMAGCAGTFTPYGVIDAQRAAVETVRITLSYLTAGSRQSQLRSWIISDSEFVARQFRLSCRGKTLIADLQPRLTLCAPGFMVRH